MINDEYSYYPDNKEIEFWINDIWRLAEETPITVEMLDEPVWKNNFGTFHYPCQFVKFIPKGMDAFYGVWQPQIKAPMPLVFHVPGYGAELSIHPDTNAEGYNVLNISPMGYWTPAGFDESKLRDGNWPVLPDTVYSKGEAGYKIWLTNCVMDVLWAWKQKSVINNRVSFYGTSQGGGTALLLGSIFANKGVMCVAADEPFLTDFPLAAWRGAYGVTKKAFDSQESKDGWHSIGFVDTVNHAHRMNYPVLLTEGEKDDTCPPETVESLYNKLPSTKSITMLSGRGHGYNYDFMRLAWAWFKLYA